MPDQTVQLIDPTVIAPRHLELGTVCYVNAGHTPGAASNLTSASASIGPGVVTSGQVSIGVGVTILPRVTIGDNMVAGAGSVVTRDGPAGCLVTDNAAEIVRREIGGYQGLRVA